MTQDKVCKHCSITKLLYEFHQGGAYCKICTKKRNDMILNNKRSKAQRKKEI